MVISITYITLITELLYAFFIVLLVEASKLVLPVPTHKQKLRMFMQYLTVLMCIFHSIWTGAHEGWPKPELLWEDISCVWNMLIY